MQNIYYRANFQWLNNFAIRQLMASKEHLLPNWKDVHDKVCDFVKLSSFENL